MPFHFVVRFEEPAKRKIRQWIDDLTVPDSKVIEGNAEAIIQLLINTLI